MSLPPLPSSYPSHPASPARVHSHGRASPQQGLSPQKKGPKEAPPHTHIKKKMPSTHHELAALSVVIAFQRVPHLQREAGEGGAVVGAVGGEAGGNLGANKKKMRKDEGR